MNMPLSWLPSSMAMPLGVRATNVNGRRPQAEDHKGHHGPSQQEESCTPAHSRGHQAPVDVPYRIAGGDAQVEEGQPAGLAVRWGVVVCREGGKKCRGGRVSCSWAHTE